MNLNKINESTPISDFPEIYNNNINELVNEINRLNSVISAKDGEIKALKDMLNKLRKEYIGMFANLENIYVKKSD